MGKRRLVHETSLIAISRLARSPLFSGNTYPWESTIVLISSFHITDEKCIIWRLSTDGRYLRLLLVYSGLLIPLLTVSRPCTGLK